MKPFPEEKLTKLKKAIDRALEDGAEPLAAFDADGTLWDMDLGETFFNYQIQSGKLDLPPDPWAQYEKLKEIDHPVGYLWLAQINAGKKLSEVQGWAKDCFEKIADPSVFPVMREVIAHLKKSGVEIYVVTASIKWAVEPGAEYLGIPRDHVLGVKTQIKDGIVTDIQEGPITWREGKLTGLLEASNRRLPFFAAGNTVGDLALLDSATHVCLVNAAVNSKHDNYETERTLAELAQKRGWFNHLYR